MAVATFTKDPDAVLDYIFDWSDWLSNGENISTSTMIVSAGLTLDSETNGFLSATAWISGGTPGHPYSVTNRITTNQGRADDRSITIRVTDR
jgi:hypothetical protein